MQALQKQIKHQQSVVHRNESSTSTIQSRQHGTYRAGLTIIEVTIGMLALGLVVQLGVVALNATRESSRLNGCKNNLRAIGQSIESHETALNYYPPGGWGFLWIGDPDRGNGPKQPGGWIYNILPYSGYQDIHDIGLGLSGDEKKKAGGEISSHAISLFACPGRRNAETPIPYFQRHQIYRNYRPADDVGKSDYAGCAGDYYPEDAEANWGPKNYKIADAATDWEHAPFWIIRATQTGVFYQASLTRRKDIPDGLSKTYFVGEKYCDPLRYRAMVTTFGDNQNMYIGADSDILRWTGHFDGRALPPRIDRENYQHDESFGSNHPAGCNYLFGDGSVSTISFDIDPEVNKAQSNRHDEQPL